MTRRKINFEATVKYTAYTWGIPGSSPLAGGEDNAQPQPCTAHTGIFAMNSKEAREKLTDAIKRRGPVADVLSVDLTLRHPHQDAALLAERDAALSSQ